MTLAVDVYTIAHAKLSNVEMFLVIVELLNFTGEFQAEEVGVLRACDREVLQWRFHHSDLLSSIHSCSGAFSLVTKYTLEVL